MSAAQRLRSGAVADRLAAMAEVIATDDPDATTVDALAACLADDRKVVQRRAAETFAALGKRGGDVRPVLLSALASSVPKQRWGAAYALSLLGDSPALALPTLLDALGSDDGDVRWAAGNILARWRGAPLVTDALQQLLATGNAAQRKMAAYCLRDLDARGPAIDRVLLAATDDPDTKVRLAAVSCIARLAIDRTTTAQRLIVLLGDPDASVRRVTAASLGLLGKRSEAVRSALTTARRSTDPSFARAAERSLRMLFDAP
jgi:HEAT repeat protein